MKVLTAKVHHSCNVIVDSSNVMWGSLTVCGRKMTIVLIILLQKDNTEKNNQTQHPKVKHTTYCKTKLVNRSTTQYQKLCNFLLAHLGQKGTSSLACGSTWFTWACMRHLVNGGGPNSGSPL